MHLLTLAMLALASALVSCGDDAGVGPCASTAVGAPTIEILGAPEEGGAGTEPIVEGAPRALVHGPQSGFHVWMNLRIRGMCPSGVRIARRMSDAVTGDVILAVGERVTFTQAPDDATAFQLSSAFPFFMCPQDLGYPIRDRVMRAEVQVTDSRGRTASTTVTMVPTCSADTQGGAYLSDCLCMCAAGGTCMPGDAGTAPD